MEELYHYGTPRHSGRYPWGSGKNPQRNKNFLQRVEDYKKQGLSEKQRAEALGMSTTKLRAQIKIASNERDKALLSEAIRLKEKGYSNVEIGKRIGKNESYVRSILQPSREKKVDALTNITNVLGDQLKDKPYLDVGKGVELQLNVSSTQLKTALEMMNGNGYKIHRFDIEQVSNPTQKTHMAVLTKDDVPYKEVRENQAKITSPEGIYFEDFGNIIKEIHPPVQVDSKRVQIKYAEQGGEGMDGVIELRPGVPDISLGNDRYAQVRIAVDGTHYLKGMAMYANDLPDGVDIRFNTNKHEGTPMKGEKSDDSVLKPLKNDPSNPFGAVIRQREYVGEDGEKHQSALNIVNDDTDWAKWSKNLSSQFLSKQPTELAKRQLDLAYKDAEQKFEDICSITNPTIKKMMLKEFSDRCDSDAVHLKAAAFPRQGTYVILPVNDLKDNEVYAPKYRDGEEVVLIRYPHAGKFEIPKLRVNNKGENAKNAREIIGTDAEHAIGINVNVAKQLSGADFDGDTVVLIPTKGQKITSSSDIKISSPLLKLKDFNPSDSYPHVEGAPDVGPKTGFHKQSQMGSVSNLITDMTIKGANDSEIARAVRHSMVIIDAEKHNLNWRQSAADNGIAELKEKYQGGKNRGASTLISKASGEARIGERKEAYRPDPETGEKIFTYTNRMYPELAKVKDSNGDYVYTEKGNILKRSTGKYKPALIKITNMEKVKDAYDLSSGYLIENIYAAHANKLKALANKARKEMVHTPNLKRSPSAAKAYEEEVKSLNAKLQICLKTAPIERQAQLIANSIVAAKKRADPTISKDKDKLKKVRANAINDARDLTAPDRKKKKRPNISISDKEWKAIQSGAISDNMLTQIIRFSKPEELAKRAMPKRTYKSISPATLSRARSWLNSGYTLSEVADNLGISTTTLSKALKGE